MNVSCYLIGGYFSRKLSQYLWKEITEACVSYAFPNEGESVAEYLNRLNYEINNKLEVCSPDIIVMDIQSILYLYDKTMGKVEEYAVKDAIEKISSTINNKFNGKRFYLIKSNVPDYYVIADELIKKNDVLRVDKDSLKAVNKLEEQIVKRTKGVLINTTVFYFYKKKRGYLLNDYLYEEECYVDISKKIISNATKGNKISSYPDFSCSVDRYIKYSGKTDLYKALEVFLDSKDYTNQFVLSASDEYVSEHKDDICKIKKIFALDSSKWEKKIDEAFVSDMHTCNVFKAFAEVLQGKYLNKEISYKELLQNGIVTRDFLKFIQQKTEEKEYAYANQVTPDNAGYYYALLTDCDSITALEYCKDKNAVKPILVDIFGSCVSRTCLRKKYSNNTKLKTNKYWFQIPHYVGAQTGVEFNERIFDDNLGEYSDIVRMQFENSIFDDILSSNAEWLIVDLYSLSHPQIYEYKGFVYSDFEGKISKKLGSRKLKVLEDKDVFSSDDELIHKSDEWIDTVKKKYGNRIILIQINYSRFSKGDDNVIYSPRDKKKTEFLDNFQQKAFNYFREELNCYTVEIARDFCPDDCGFEKRANVHYSYDFYREALKILEYIIFNEPEEKRFTKIDGSVRVRRLIDYLSSNSPEITSIFFDYPLDKIVMSLPLNKIRKYKDNIAVWYENDYSSKEEILSNWKSSWTDEFKEVVSKSDITNILKIEKDIPKDYINEPSLGHYLNYNEKIPYSISEYSRSEMEKTVKTVKSLLNEKALVFILVTDIHYKSVAQKSGAPFEITFERMIRNMKEFLKYVDCEFIMDLGDDTDGDFTNLGEYFEAGEYVQSNFLKLNKPFYKAIGNSDIVCRENIVDVQTTFKAYMSHIPLYGHVSFNPESYGTEYYVDLEKYGFRLIVLNTMFGGTDQYAENTGEWLSNRALKTDFNILLCEHLSCNNSLNINSREIINRESVVEALNNFEGKIIEFCGHSHCDYNSDDLSPWLTVFTNLQKCNRRNQLDINKRPKGIKGNIVYPKREGFTESEDCWDVVVVRPESQKINFVRFGAGDDREFDYSQNLESVKLEFKDISVLLCGGNILLGLSPLVRREFNEKSKFVYGYNPLCDDTVFAYNKQNDVILNSDNGKFEYLILDFECISSILKVDSGILCSQYEESVDNDKLKNHLVDPLLLPIEKIHSLMDKFINLIKNKWSCEKIIVIKHFTPSFCAHERFLQDSKLAKGQKNTDKFIGRMEDYFIAKTGCHCVDITKFYFFEKKKAERELNLFYEKECYEDLLLSIKRIIDNKIEDNIKPSFELSLRRTKRYKNSFNQHAISKYLDSSSFCEVLLSEASLRFLDIFENEILRLNKEYSDFDSLKENHFSKEFYSIIKAFYALLNCKYDMCTEEEYALLFRWGLVPDNTIKALQKKIVQNGGCKNLIKKENAGYYFAIDMGFNPLKFINDKTTVTPTVVDIFGSCFSRNAFSIINDDFAIGGYWFHVPCWEKYQLDKGKEYNKTAFPEELNWSNRLVKLQFEKQVFDEVKSSLGEWLVLDLYFFMSPVLYDYEGFIYSDLEGKISRKLGSKKIKIYTEDTWGDFDEIISRSNEFIELIKSKYEDRIILLNPQRSYCWIGDDDKIYKYEQQDYEKQNRFVQKAFDYFSQRLNCYLIDISGQFLSDDNSFVSMKSPHKEDAYYITIHDIVKQIVNDYPVKKKYDKIPGNIEVERILRMNKDIPLDIKMNIFDNCFFDRIVVGMDRDVVLKFKGDIAQIYDRDYNNVQELLSDFSWEGREELKEEIEGLYPKIDVCASVINKQNKLSIYNNLQTDYQDDYSQKYYLDGNNNHKKFQLEDVTGLGVERDGNSNILTWDKNPSFDKYVIYYRQDNKSPWKRIKELNVDETTYCHSGTLGKISYGIRGIRRIENYVQLGKMSIVEVGRI